ncbi:unnamed protein product [Parnassius apollo]|uniref:(apollo) hypothetical protein n=1 Tax=Parnassius apollo TaxID=110799 RepID=A0A8S3XNH0_PARAO|nr:unnamed protein product [Parnassius apollo]
MEEFLELSADTAEDDRILDRIKLLAQESLLVGWLNWKTLDLFKVTLFENKLNVDPEILNKLRFALPTVGLAQTFNPLSVDLPEKQYRDLKLHASPVFDSLKVNTHLEGLVSKSYNQKFLERADELTGSLTHGLLKQRQILMEGIKSLAAKHTGAYEDIKQMFLGESQFKEVSDDLLQFTCARRAEIIEMRRKALKPKEQQHVAKLSEIPPSQTHLFDIDLLSKFLDQRGGLSKIFSKVDDH